MRMHGKYGLAYPTTLLLLSSACFGEPSMVDSETGETGDGDGDLGDGDGDGETASSETGDGDLDPAECGNGIVEAGEDCDDGNDDDTDACTSLCAAPSCDDGLVSGDETDVDCGGDCEGCGAGQACVVDDDCADSSCYAGVCLGACEPWDERIGSAENDAFYGLAADRQGYFYAVGETQLSIDGNAPQGANDGILVKYNAAGELVFTRQYGSSVGDIALAASANAEGSVAITGYTYGEFDGNLSAGDRDALVTVYDTEGAHLWSEQIGTPAEDTGATIAIGPEGQVIAGISTRGGYDEAVNGGATDILLVAYDDQGAQQWNRQFSEAGPQSVQGLAVDPFGDVVATGWSSGPFDGNDPIGLDDIVVFELDPGGTVVWSSQLGTPEQDNATALAVDPEGNIYVTGQTRGDLDGAQNAGGLDLLVIKVSSAGDKLWSAQLGTPQDDYGLDIALDEDGNIYVGGVTLGDLDGGGHQGEGDLFVAKLDDGGQLEWVNQRGTFASDAARAIAVGSLGEVVVAGFSYGDLGGASFGMADAYIGRFCEP